MELNMITEQMEQFFTKALSRNKIEISFIKSCLLPVATLRNNGDNELIFFSSGL